MHAFGRSVVGHQSVLCPPLPKIHAPKIKATGQLIHRDSIATLQTQTALPHHYPLATPTRRRRAHWKQLQAASSAELGVQPPDDKNDQDENVVRHHQDAEPDISAEEMDAALAEAAERFEAFCAEFPDVDEETLHMLGSEVPGVGKVSPAEAREKLEKIARELQVPLQSAARLVALVPEVWDRPLPTLAPKLSPLAAQLGVDASTAVDLIAAVPAVWEINAVSIVKDKLDTLATRLGVALARAVDLVIHQPLLWCVPPQHIISGVPSLCRALGLGEGEAEELVVRSPVVVALERQFFRLQMQGLAATLGVPTAALLDLAVVCPTLLAVPAEVLGANIDNLARALGVPIEAALQLVLEQPTLLCAQLATLTAALDALVTALSLPTRAAGLALLCDQPALLYDLPVPAINERLEALAAVFKVPLDRIRSEASSHPVLLTISTTTLRTALDLLSQRWAESDEGGEALSGEQALELLTGSPGDFVLLGYPDSVLDSWAGRLQLSTEQVAGLVRQQPALLEISPNTMKARIESLAALFEIPSSVVLPLVARHTPLAIIPPNTTITRVKSISLALGCSMQAAAQLVGKQAAAAVCTISAPGELNKDLKPHQDDMQQIIASYEYYRTEWMERHQKQQVKEREPASFSSIDKRYSS